MRWIRLISVLLIGASGCATAPKPTLGTVEFWRALQQETQTDLDACELDRLQCEEDCDATTPYYK